MQTPSRKPASPDVAFVVLRPTGRDDFVSLRQKRRDYFVKARAIGPSSVTEHDARFGLHGHLHKLRRTAYAVLRDLASFVVFYRDNRRAQAGAWGRGCCRLHRCWGPDASPGSVADPVEPCGRSWPRCTKSPSTEG